MTYLQRLQRYDLATHLARKIATYEHVMKWAYRGYTILSYSRKGSSVNWMLFDGDKLILQRQLKHGVEPITTRIKRSFDGLVREGRIEARED